MISIIIRTKNERRWLERCLTAVRHQDYPSFEAIVVDNESSDGSAALARKFGCKVVYLGDRDYKHGHALNVGIGAARGEHLAILSGHCIPVHDQWLSALAAHFEDAQVAGVYGRQVPLPDSDPFDKRDLWTTFGPERRTQRIDYFFHNANSMISREIWRKYPFDDTIKGVEDREWAKTVVARGYRIVYEPLASVHHFHGIHQGRDEKRAERVVRVIEMIHSNGRIRASRSR
jgi:glycosyltransferase involved in cell wall biosynthesis